VTLGRLAALGLLVIAAARAGGAQSVPELRIEAGHALVRQRGFEAASAALLGVSWRMPTDHWTFLSSASLTYAQDSLAAAHGVAAISLPWSVSEHLQTELGLAGASFSLLSLGRGGNVNGFTRQHFVGPNRGTWVGGGVARSSRDGVHSTSSALDAGVWQRIDFLYISGSITRQSTSDRPLLMSAGVPGDPDLDRFRLLDGQVALQVRNGPHEFTLSWTARTGLEGTEADFGALSVGGVLQLAERVALMGGGGRQLADPLRGLPQADVFTIAARLSLGPKPLPVMQRSVIAQAQVVPAAGGGGELSVRVFATDTMLVDIAGDFSEWQPIPLEREGPFWVARVMLPSGKYRVAVRVNLGAWRAPRNLARVRDDYGGESGLVVVP